MRCDAAAAYRALSDAYAGAFGTPLCLTDSYRTYAEQVRLYGEKPERFGFLHPTWADPGNGREEPWHWEYAGA